MTDEYYIPDVKKPKDLSNDVGNYTGALKEFIDSDDGSIKVKLEHDVIVERVANTIYTSWLSGIRELLTNELKACKLARDNFKANPYMVITINPIERKLIIQGYDSLGITAQRFGKIVAWLGRSHNKDRNSIGMFGMGIEAYTTLSSTLKIESNPRETPENFTVLGRDGMRWLPLEETTNIPYGCKLTMVLNKDLGDTKFFKQLIERVKDVVALHGIPTTIHLEDEVDDDDSDYSMGDHEVELLDKQGYMLRQIDHANALERYNYTDIDKTTAKTLHINKDTYDITILFANNSGHNSGVNDDDHLFTTLIDVPIKSEYDSKSRVVVDKINDLELNGLLSRFPNFTALLINLKDESIYPPVASRDSLKDGWLTKEMLRDCYDLVCDWYDENRIDKLDELFNMTSQDINTWHWLYQYSEDRNDEDDDDKKQLKQCIDLRFNIYKDNRKKYDHITFLELLTQSSSHDINYGNVFYMSNFYRDKIIGIDEELGETCTYIRLAYKDTDKVIETFNYLIDKMNELCDKDDMYFYDTVSWLKNRKVKIKIRRVARPKGSIVWHYNKLNNYSYDETQVSSSIYYDKNRHDDYSMKNVIAKKKIRLQLTEKRWGKHRLSIADIVGLLNQIPTDIMFCKADTDLNANSVDDYIKGVMNRIVFTSQGNYKMSELVDKFRDTNDLEVKLVYYPYSDVINEKCFGTNKKQLYICAKNNDELIGLGLAFITDGYIHDNDWSIVYDDKNIVNIDNYGSDPVKIDEKMKVLMPNEVIELLSSNRFIGRWKNAEHKGCMILALVDLHRSIPNKYFNDVARSLTYTDTFKELSDEVKRVKELYHA